MKFSPAQEKIVQTAGLLMIPMLFIGWVLYYCLIGIIQNANADLPLANAHFWIRESMVLRKLYIPLLAICVIGIFGANLSLSSDSITESRRTVLDMIITLGIFLLLGSLWFINGRIESNIYEAIGCVGNNHRGVSLAIYEYHIIHGKYPDTIDDVVPYLDENFSIYDAFTGGREKLWIDQTPQHVGLFSVGPDMERTNVEGAVPIIDYDPTNGTFSSGDLVTRIENPATWRHQP